MTERRKGGAADALRAALAGEQHRRPSIADGTVAADLVEALRRLADNYGATGVARAAAELAGGVMHPPGEVCGLTPGARRTDPSTSARAAERAAPRARSVAAKLLRAYGRAATLGAPEDGLTADEAGALIVEPGSWRRISDLVSAGLIEPTELERPGRSGREQRVHRITPAGRALLASWHGASS